MKKASLILLLFGATITVNAQSTTEATTEVATECISEEAAETEQKAKKKKHKSRMGIYTKANQTVSNSPYGFASSALAENRKKIFERKE